MAEVKQQDKVYEEGWLDAYGRRPAKQPFHDQPGRYRDGYNAGKSERKQADKRLSKAGLQ